MARPTKPKDLKPKAEGDVAAAPGAPPAGGGPALDIKFIVLALVMVVSSILGSAGSAYLMTTLFVTPEIQKIAKAAPSPEGASSEGGAKDGASTETPGNEVGMNLELDEFTINLKPDPVLGGNQFLRAKMALSIKPPDTENCYLEKKKAAFLPDDIIPGGKVVGAAMPVDNAQVDKTLVAEGEGGGAAPCETEFKTSMGKYVPTIRDVINASLMKRTATQLATLEGQEALKDEIKDQLSQIMAPNYKVIRVNFQDFIIQR
jgi:flagellar basal body-associated protein FliL